MQRLRAGRPSLKHSARNNSVPLRGSIDSSPSRVLNRELVERLKTVLPWPAYAECTAVVGQCLGRAGERLTRLPVVESGRLELLLHVGEQGRQVIPVTFEAGELALSSALFSTEPIEADLIVGENLVARWLPIGDVERCLLESRDLLVLTVRMLAQRLREVQAREQGWLQRGVHERVRIVLQRIARDTRAQPDGHVMLAVTHEYLAARCGLSRPKLSHELKRMEHAGMLKLHRGAIELVDPAGLVHVG